MQHKQKLDHIKRYLIKHKFMDIFTYDGIFPVILVFFKSYKHKTSYNPIINFVNKEGIFATHLYVKVNKYSF